MPRLQPVRVEVLIRVFEADGWARARQRGSHLSMTKPGHKRPVVIIMDLVRGHGLPPGTSGAVALRRSAALRAAGAG